MIDMGIKSFKVEGRMRSVYYIATVISTYRKAIDEYLNNKENYEYNIEYENILNNVANRDSISQFFNGNFGMESQYYNGRIEYSNQDFLGIVLEYDKSRSLAKIEQRNYFKVGDEIEFFGPNKTFTYKIKEIFDSDMNNIDIVRHPREIVYLKVEENLENYDMLRIKRV